MLGLLQVAGQLFVLGEGDCGQLGKGEDYMSAGRPVPSLEGTQVLVQWSAASPTSSDKLLATFCVCLPELQLSPLRFSIAQCPHKLAQ